MIMLGTRSIESFIGIRGDEEKAPTSPRASVEVRDQRAIEWNQHRRYGRLLSCARKGEGSECADAITRNDRAMYRRPALANIGNCLIKGGT